MIFFSKMTGLVPSFFLFSSLSHLMPFMSTFSPRSAMEATASSFKTALGNDEGETFRIYMSVPAIAV